MDYEDAEAAGRDEQETHGRPTLAQWARAQALRAALPTYPNMGLDEFNVRVNRYAEFIIEGALRQ